MSKAKMKAGRQAQEVGAAIVETWLKLLPTPAAILSVPSAVGDPLRIKINRRIFSVDDLAHLREQGKTKATRYKVGSVANVNQFNQTLDVLDENTSAAVLTTADHKNNLGGGFAIPVVREPDTALGDELTAVLKEIVDVADIEVFFDTPTKIHIAVPRIPDRVLTRSDLMEYLREYHQFGQGQHYHDALGVAVIFGCR